MWKLVNERMDLRINSVDNKEIELKTTANIEFHDDFIAQVIPRKGKITVNSDLEFVEI